MSRLVASEILTQTDSSSRVQAIEKWTAVADICRCLHNFNGVLQICSAFTNSAIFRLKDTWAKVHKSVSILNKGHAINADCKCYFSRPSKLWKSFNLWFLPTVVFAVCETLSIGLIRLAFLTLECTCQIWPSSKRERQHSQMPNC